ncbi:hypothetical protein SEA_BAUER_78 [Arthrobacter phage Bauer]|uniref:Uncharacterized protein n=1 Tax=Arthrobacter phage Bauer TaxID=2985648 RepID=A0A9E8A9Y3_9CAUD|nr:hypothetical protein QEO99_gp78 [Arthrobacter phage Bauer]UYM26627.1 hypothetical protein SEA_BAUER_78 [Arthrobacter phage Bauer]
MKYDEIYEDDGGGDLGCLIGFNIHGHIDFQQVEEFLATEAAEWFDDENAPERGFDAEHLWVRKVPREYGWSFQYQAAPGRGAKAVTRLQVETTWEKRCYRHPFEVASTGFHETAFIDGAGKGDDRQFIYYCRPCADRIRGEQEAARKEALAQYYAEKAAKEAAETNEAVPIGAASSIPKENQ